MNGPEFVLEDPMCVLVRLVHVQLFLQLLWARLSPVLVLVQQIHIPSRSSILGNNLPFLGEYQLIKSGEENDTKEINNIEEKERKKK